MNKRAAVELAGLRVEFRRLLQEVAAVATVEDATKILGTVDPLDLSEDEVAKLIDVARDK
jgi:hypothetical protein